jgi:hypothetical protein
MNRTKGKRSNIAYFHPIVKTARVKTEIKAKRGYFKRYGFSIVSIRALCVIRGSFRPMISEKAERRDRNDKKERTQR